jgi:hypothetical protein
MNEKKRQLMELRAIRRKNRTEGIGSGLTAEQQAALIRLTGHSGIEKAMLLPSPDPSAGYNVPIHW